MADRDYPNHIVSEVPQPSGVVVVEGDLHYMDLLISSRVTTRMVPMAQGTVGILYLVLTRTTFELLSGSAF